MSRWRTDTLEAIDTVLNDPELLLDGWQKKQIRDAMLRVVIDQTGVFVDRYRAEILNAAY